LSAEGPGPHGLTRVFTLREANELLPEVQRTVTGLLAARQRVVDLAPELAPAAEAAARNGGTGVGGPVLAEVLRMRDAINFLLRLGVQLKDLEVGLVDFPARREGREVLLCWRPGEERVGFWHEVDAGFAGRLAVDPAEWE
jgi:hypothetical protein